jgi:hypothetical protein
MTMVVDATPELVAASLAFHLNAGVDYVVAADPGTDGRTTEVLESFSTDVVRRLAVGAPARASATELARLAMEPGAEWVVPSRADEFWWPRGESLRDVLAVIPPRYGVVQALVREFVADGDEDTYFAERMTIRTSLLDAKMPPGDLHGVLKPVYRAQPDLVLHDSDWTLGGRRVPLRAWYPIEVFRFGGTRSDQLDAHRTLVEDTRLRDALRLIREQEDGGRSLTLPVPSVVDDASYAIECAAVGEVDLVSLDRHIRELEQRIAALEARLWPRVQRTLRRLARRPS